MSSWEAARWHEWDAVRCVAGDAEMIVGVSAGPRILSLRWRGGPNLLHRDETDFGVGNWRIFGGHRLSVAPEGEGSYPPDNAPCLVRCEGKWLQVESPRGADLLRRTLAIAPATGEDGFEVKHILENAGPQVWSGAVWAITCVSAEGCIVSPCEPAGSRLKFWNQPGNSGFRSQWEQRRDHIVTTPQSLRGKAGWHSSAGWLAQLRPDATLVIDAPEVCTSAQCVDGGCNVEVFTCPNFLEMETLGPRVTLAAGERATHLQRWRLLPGGFAPAQWCEIGDLAGCHTANNFQLVSTKCSYAA